MKFKFGICLCVLFLVTGCKTQAFLISEDTEIKAVGDKLCVADGAAINLRSADCSKTGRKLTAADGQVVVELENVKMGSSCPVGDHTWYKIGLKGESFYIAYNGDWIGTKYCSSTSQWPKAGENFFKQGFFGVSNGRIVDPTGMVWRGIGINLPTFRNLMQRENPLPDNNPVKGILGAPNYDDILPQDLDRRIEVVRILAAGNVMLSIDTETLRRSGIGYGKNEFNDPNSALNKIYDAWANWTVAGVKALASQNKRVIVAFADYYHHLPGENLVKGDHDNTEWCDVVDGVRPWSWYVKSPEWYNFTSRCFYTKEQNTTKYKRTNEPNYRVWYLSYVKKIVSALKDNPHVFAWALGNELRALGRGGAPQEGLEKTNQEGVRIFADFITDMVSEIRKIDGNHLIIPGVQNLREVGNGMVDEAFNSMIKLPLNMWNLTFYDNDPGVRADIAKFSNRRVPVIATEWDTYNCDLDIKNAICDLYKEGVSLLMPWSKVQMNNVYNKCGQSWEQKILFPLLDHFDKIKNGECS